MTKTLVLLAITLQICYNKMNFYASARLTGGIRKRKGTERMSMKRIVCLLIICCLAAGAVLTAGGVSFVPVRASLAEEAEEVPDGDDSEASQLEEAEEDEAGEGDDSEPVPVDMMEEDEVEEEIQDARILQYGDSGDDVLDLQNRLKDLKYYTGNLSGNFKEGTREAVKAFQKDFDLEVSGVADIQTQSLLFSVRYRPLRYGSAGEDVKNLQTRLTELGYYKGKISGNFLEATQKAVEAFQEKNGLDTDGIADTETQNALYAGSAVGKDDKKAAAGAVPTPVPDLSGFLVDENETDGGVRVADGDTAFTKKLKNGSSGKLVKQLQQRMADLGYYDGPVSGNFMRNTTRAVKKIQEQNAVKATGVVDEETWNLIFNDSRIVLPDATPKPTPEPTPVPFAITVDVANQVTTVYGRDENGEYNVVVRQILCSTGLKATPSDVGDWVLNGRHANWCYFPKWGSYARYWTRINSSIAFHSVIYYSVSVTNMNTSSYYKLGKRASHGCIRLSVADAKWIYDNVGAGTVVSIVEGMDPDPELRDALKLPKLNEKTQTPVETPEPTAEPDYPAAEKPSMKGTLQENSANETVYWVQRRLAELGFYKGKCSGKFLSGTKKAVKAFQKANGIKQSGVVDQTTLNALWDAIQPIQVALPETTPAPAGAE